MRKQLLLPSTRKYDNCAWLDSQISLQINRPSPVPLVSVVKNGSNICIRYFSSMPLPSSTISRTGFLDTGSSLAEILTSAAAGDFLEQQKYRTARFAAQPQGLIQIAPPAHQPDLDRVLVRYGPMWQHKKNGKY